MTRAALALALLFAIVPAVARADPAPTREQMRANLIAPDPSRQGDVAWDDYSFECVRGCTGKAKCRVRTVRVACPAALLPHLKKGVAPTRKKGKRCWYGSARVACPR